MRESQVSQGCNDKIDEIKEACNGKRVLAQRRRKGPWPREKNSGKRKFRPRAITLQAHAHARASAPVREDSLISPATPASSRACLSLVVSRGSWDPDSARSGFNRRAPAISGVEGREVGGDSGREPGQRIGPTPRRRSRRCTPRYHLLVFVRVVLVVLSRMRENCVPRVRVRAGELCRCSRARA